MKKESREIFLYCQGKTEKFVPPWFSLFQKKRAVSRLPVRGGFSLLGSCCTRTGFSRHPQKEEETKKGRALCGALPLNIQAGT